MYTIAPRGQIRAGGACLPGQEGVSHATAHPQSPKTCDRNFSSSAPLLPQENDPTCAVGRASTTISGATMHPPSAGLYSAGSSVAGLHRELSCSPASAAAPQPAPDSSPSHGGMATGTAAESSTPAALQLSSSSSEEVQALGGLCPTRPAQGGKRRMLHSGRTSTFRGVTK